MSIDELKEEEFEQKIENKNAANIKEYLDYKSAEEYYERRKDAK
jgi:predicted house-cleaning noncanonical NTP pyrophosphatase (MazG superfamily)